MQHSEARPGRTTRRVFMMLAPAVASAQGPDAGQVLPAQRVRYIDRATEFIISRVTSPDYDTWVPASPGGGISGKASSMVVTAAPGGRKTLIWLDLATGAGRGIAQPADLKPESVALTADDRWVAYADGQELAAIQRQGSRRQVLTKLSPDAVLQAGLAASADRISFFFAESAAGGARLRSVRLGTPQSPVLAESEEPVAEIAPNPRRALLAWRTESGALWVAALGGGRPRQMESPGGTVLQFHWSRDGSSILYLHEPADRTKLVEIREQQVDARTDIRVAKTSQFACFAPNANGTAFVGASRSKASPHILLLLRATQREFTLCEHGDEAPALCRPVFTPDSQSVVFSSRMHGRRAIYVAGVEKLIEKTS